MRADGECEGRALGMWGAGPATTFSNVTAAVRFSFTRGINVGVHRG